jgi:poly(3-hydroxybutyrate) depolymerase
MTGTQGRIPSLSIWHGDSDTRVAPRNRQELVEQWTAVHGIAATPARVERSGPLSRELYTDDAGIARVESVLVAGLGHAVPISTSGTAPCGQPGDFVVSAGVCAATEIARFWSVTVGP